MKGRRDSNPAGKAQGEGLNSPVCTCISLLVLGTRWGSHWAELWKDKQGEERMSMMRISMGMVLWQDAVGKDV